MSKTPKITAVTILGVIGFMVWWQSQSACQARGGRWATNGSYCIESNCFESSTCGKWAYPQSRCPNLKAGDTVSKVYFELGQSDSVANTDHFWSIGKAEAGEIHAVIVNQQLAELYCDGT